MNINYREVKHSRTFFRCINVHRWDKLNDFRFLSVGHINLLTSVCHSRFNYMSSSMRWKKFPILKLASFSLLAMTNICLNHFIFRANILCKSNYLKFIEFGFWTFHERLCTVTHCVEQIKVTWNDLNRWEAIFREQLPARRMKLCFMQLHISSFASLVIELHTGGCRFSGITKEIISLYEDAAKV